MADKFYFLTSYNYVKNNPIEFIDPDGKAPFKPTPREAAAMAAHVYGDKKDNLLVGGWRVSGRDFGISLNDKETGLKSQVYERTKNGKTEYTYATAGTDGFLDPDAVADLMQPVGLSDQYRIAAKNAKNISEILGSTELSFTGHSLGGGEAALNALITDRSAITFNAAGVGDITKFRIGNRKTPFKSEERIKAYILDNDPLNAMQFGSPLPDANGSKIFINTANKKMNQGGHSIDSVLQILGFNPWEQKKEN